jgi:hypothetical protein
MMVTMRCSELTGTNVALRMNTDLVDAFELIGMHYC